MCRCQVDELTSENAQLKDRVALLEKMLDLKNRDAQLFNKIMAQVDFMHCYISVDMIGYLSYS